MGSILNFTFKSFIILKINKLKIILYFFKLITKMKRVKIGKPYKERETSFTSEYIFTLIYDFFYRKISSILSPINFILTIYLLIQNNKFNKLINEIKLSNHYNENKETNHIDKDMIGLKYPEILFDKIKTEFSNGKIISSFNEFLKQLEIKLIYLEKEINVTKLISFYTSRTSYLKSLNINYDDSKITYFHDIMNWLVIHKSTQLKGIASDKYLVCKYAKIKLGKNLCPQRIGVYDTVEEIDFEKLIKMGNVVLKISNGCFDNIFITDKNTLQDIDKIKKEVTFHFNREFSLIVPEFFHLYSRKRIVLEKTFIPLTDLYEFKFFVFNHEIKMVKLNYFKNINKMLEAYYDDNFNSIKDVGEANFNCSYFDNNLLNTMKSYAIKLSEDFPNFIRVDLYIFHNDIYLSELTFDSHNGKPRFFDIKHFVDGIKNWKRVDY